ncbi:hypothetical protein [Ideonella livida]|uniref:Uncharacterized protein n=1 Tax=Ideonella livida TaxID=2707176 RepID=A0A7C9PG89_9BURK|nr:hypothetical protein [Ideonella livida]NDY90988.1 hypothetical protein [Ideonella livida]
MAAITSQTFHAHALPRMPRGARAGAEVFLAGMRLLRHWLGGTQPARLTRAQEAEAVRSLAREHEKSDPGFAADLYAAAARHEGKA